MLSPALKRYILPFSPDKIRESISSDLEIGAVYAFAESERAKGGGLIIKQPEENILFIAKIGYPIWLFPSNGANLILDGLSNYSYIMNYTEVPNAQTFIDSLDKNSTLKENYFSFLSNSISYFQQPKKEKKLDLTGLIADSDFKKDFLIYRKEAKEAIDLNSLVFLVPMLEQATISSILAELEKTQSFFKENANKLLESLRIVNKTTGQYITELDYASEAINDEFNAKINAQEELVNPQITKLNREYKQRISTTTKNFDEDIEKLEKLKTNTLKFIETNEEKVRYYQKQAEIQANNKHFIYERQWKEKSSQTKREVNGQKKDLKRAEKNLKELNKQKTTELFKIQTELEAEIKSARRPLLELENARDSKILAFKEETRKLVELERPVINEIKSAIKLNEEVNSKFQDLTIEGLRLDNPALFYVPFYAVCYQAGLTKRFILIPPSTTATIGLTNKLKSAFGKPKIKEIFNPRFKTITDLIERTEQFLKNNSSSDNQIGILGEKNNLLRAQMVRGSTVKGLSYLRDQGWLSDKETQDLSSRLASA